MVVVELDDIQVSGPGGLLKRLAALPDPRSSHGRLYPLAGLLTIAAAAVLSGSRTYTMIGEFAQELPQATLARLGMWQRPYSTRYVAPSEGTLRRVLQEVDPDELDRLVGGWLAEQQRPAHADAEPDAVAVDGKTLRGARQTDGRQVQLFAALAHGSGTVLAQREVPQATNEITQFQPLLEEVDLEGKVVTADALHTQADHARWLVEDRHADYVFCVKGNQPTLEDAISRLPARLFPPAHTETGRGHGRLEQRTIRTASPPAALGFPHLAQLLVIDRHVCDLDGRSRFVELAYGVTSLTAAQADPTRLLRLVRGQWEIENRLHWVRDVTFDEDRSQIRAGHGPRVMASLRNLAISLLRLAGHRNIARGVRWAGHAPTRALGLLGV